MFRTMSSVVSTAVVSGVFRHTAGMSLVCLDVAGGVVIVEVMLDEVADVMSTGFVIEGASFSLPLVLSVEAILMF